MIDLQTVFETLYTELQPTMEKLGFHALLPEKKEKGAPPVFERNDQSSFLAYAGDKGTLRILYTENKIRLLAGEKGAKSEDDSDYSLLASFLLILDEYDRKDLKSVLNEITENLEEAYSPKQIAKRQQTVKAQATVSRSAVKSGTLMYDPATLAIRLSALYPEIKETYKAHIDKYDDFLCEDFFLHHVNPYVEATIRENNPQKMKKLFSILNEIYEDGTNEVQDIIVVTMLASFDYPENSLQNVLNYVSDTVMEPFIRVNKILKSSKSARMRLENPPKYKPKKKKKKKASGLFGGSFGQ